MSAALHAVSDDEENNAIGDSRDDRRRQLADPITTQGMVVGLDVVMNLRRRCGSDSAAASAPTKRLGGDNDGPNDGEQLGKCGENRSGHEENRDLIRFVRAIFYRTGCWPKFHLDKQ